MRTTGNIRTDGGTIYHAADSRLNIYNNTDATDSRAWIELWGYDPPLEAHWRALSRRHIYRFQI